MKAKKIRAWAVAANVFGDPMDRPCVWLSGDTRVWALCVTRDEAMKYTRGSRKRILTCTITFTPPKRKGAKR